LKDEKVQFPCWAFSSPNTADRICRTTDAVILSLERSEGEEALLFLLLLLLSVLLIVIPVGNLLLSLSVKRQRRVLYQHGAQPYEQSEEKTKGLKARLIDPRPGANLA
jgi:hypothetical protein